MKKHHFAMILTVCFAVMAYCSFWLDFTILSYFLTLVTGALISLSILIYYGQKVQARHEENLLAFIKNLQKNLGENVKS